MQCIAIEIEATELAKLKIPTDGARFGNTAHQISGMIQDANEVIKDLIKQYRALSAQQSILLREYEIKDCKKPDFSDVGNPHTPASYGHFNKEYEATRNAA